MEKKKKNLPDDYKKVLRLIPMGSAKPITVSEIEKLTGFTSTRIRHVVSDSIITHEIPVETSNRVNNPGYYYATSQEEREQTLKNMSSRLGYLAKRIKVLKDAPIDIELDFLD